MALTRKHFIDLADVVVEQVRGSDMTHGQIDRLVDSIAFVCRKHNSNFNYDRFRDYIESRIDLNWDGTAEDSTSNEPEVI